MTPLIPDLPDIDAPGFRILYRRHAELKMAERRISKDDVRKVLRDPTTVEYYPREQPFPTRLVLGYSGDRPLHVVLALDDTGGTIYVVTVYDPEPGSWDEGYTERKL